MGVHDFSPPPHTHSLPPSAMHCGGMLGLKEVLFVRLRRVCIIEFICHNVKCKEGQRKISEGV